MQRRSRPPPLAIRLNKTTATTLSLRRPRLYPNIQHKGHYRLQRLGCTGSRAIVAHLASSLNPTTQLNIAATYKTSDFTEVWDTTTSNSIS